LRQSLFRRGFSELSTRSINGSWTWRRNLSGAILSWLCVKDHNCTGLNGHHRLWQPSRDTKHLVLSKKQNKKKQYRRKIKKAKKQKKKKKQKRLLENLIWIGTHDLMQDNVTMTERDKMGLFQTKYSVATHSFAP